MTAPPLGCALRPVAGPREPGAGEVLLPHGEDDRQEARLAAVRGTELSGLQAGVVGGENARAGVQTTFPSSRRDPSVKRTVCRGCFSLLLPGLTCTQRQRRECSLRVGKVGSAGGQVTLPRFGWMFAVGFAGAGVDFVPLELS